MSGFYSRWMDWWERKLATRDTNRVVRPFQWGTDWLARIQFPHFPNEANREAAVELSRFVDEAIRESDRFYGYTPVSDYRLDDNRLTFSSPVRSGYPENDI